MGQRGPHAALLAEMVYALRSELGASYVYPALARASRDTELASVLSELGRESAEQVRALQELVRGLGGRPARSRLRRLVAARVLALVSPLTGMRLPLRLCCDAEGTVSRWYAGYAAYFVRLGDEPRARACSDLSQAKYRHSILLRTWVDR